MSATLIAPLPYSLEEACPVPWTEAAEGQLHRDYPFLNQDVSTQEFVIRRYLETLWLPESLNPLSHFILSLRRISHTDASSSSQPHHLHSLLEPLLLSTRAASDKYRAELVRILANGGGAEEQEEMMMWFAWELEKVGNEEGGKLDEEKWQKAWLERLERREAMIQALLLMLKLSLPGPKPSSPMERPKGRNRRKRKQESPPETTEERLENYMDKLAVWQLTATLDATMPSSHDFGRNQLGVRAAKHWTQSFYESIVEPLFKSELPGQCELFRSKLFPEPPISDSEQSDIDKPINDKASRAGSRAPSIPRRPHSRAPSVSGTQVQFIRSRSLSVSLAQDEASQRASVVGPRHALSREVSMSRVFKERPKTRTKYRATQEEQKPETEKSKTKRDSGMTLVQETPMKHHCSASEEHSGWYNWCQRIDGHFAVPSPPPTSSSDPGDVYIEDTPVASRTRRNNSQTKDFLSPLSRPPSDTSGSLRVTRARQQNFQDGFGNGAHADESYIDAFKLPKVMLMDGDEDDEMLLSSLPAVRNINLSNVDKGADVEMATPTKRMHRRK